MQVGQGRDVVISPAMNNSRLDSIIRDYGEVIHDDTIGCWKFEYRDRVLIVVTDEAQNRVRVMTPVAEAADLGEEIWLMCMSANFDRAMDARYAVSGDYVWSLFVHSLRTLEPSEFVDAMDQVGSLAKNFGSTFSSVDLFFNE